jgi:type IV secretion system protein TrbD
MNFQEQRRCPIHPALIRPILFAGADRRLVMVNVTLILALIFGVGIHTVTVIAALFLCVVGQGIFMHLAKTDAYFVDIYLHHLRYRDFYLARGSILRKDTMVYRLL